MKSFSTFLAEGPNSWTYQWGNEIPILGKSHELTGTAHKLEPRLGSSQGRLLLKGSRVEKIIARGLDEFMKTQADQRFLSKFQKTWSKIENINKVELEKLIGQNKPSEKSSPKKERSELDNAKKLAQHKKNLETFERLKRKREQNEQFQYNMNVSNFLTEEAATLYNRSIFIFFPILDLFEMYDKDKKEAYKNFVYEHYPYTEQNRKQWFMKLDPFNDDNLKKLIEPNKGFNLFLKEQLQREIQRKQRWGSLVVRIGTDEKYLSNNNKEREMKKKESNSRGTSMTVQNESGQDVWIYNINVINIISAWCFGHFSKMNNNGRSFNKNEHITHLKDLFRKNFDTRSYSVAVYDV